MVQNHNPSPLQVARILAGVRQADIASVVGRSIIYVSRLERGKSARLTPEVAARIESILTCAFRRLVCGEKSMNSQLLPHPLPNEIFEAQKFGDNGADGGKK